MHIEQLSEATVILIVDDNPANLRVLSESLAEAGFDVAVATSGESVIKHSAVPVAACSTRKAFCLVGSPD